MHSVRPDQNAPRSSIMIGSSVFERMGRIEHAPDHVVQGPGEAIPPRRVNQVRWNSSYHADKDGAEATVQGWD